ncbi:MAG: DeoR/GlpR family DNA-binding transcription regulator [Ilyomonas sp.]
MLKEERFDFILNKLKLNRLVKLNELSKDLQVSEDTVRRDIESLSKNGLLLKVRGGAIPHSPNAHSFKERIHVSEQNKELIASKALELLESNQTILLDGGTTTYTLAALLPKDLPITVVTNNIPIAALLMEHPTANVIVSGGKVFKDSQVTIGMEAIHLLQNIRVDICFVGVCSIHHEIGVSTVDYDEAEVKRVMIQSANRVVAVTTHDKIGTAESYKVCDISVLDSIITDRDTDDVLFEPYKELKIKII